ncbi:DNA adenine methylase [Cryobacterium sp. Y11]|uniref:DNA adenine methylase n=1 Tax=Cryobacterium sp. Y11 TaxID=2045016 RepID=UPI000CE2C6B7|nr:DNA adenine methylase [Cryobacterium sp. Y11]
MTIELPLEFPQPTIVPFNTQLLKWIGNKQRMAPEIISFFPPTWEAYHEPFLGSGGVLGTLAPARAQAADVLPPLMEIWQMLRNDPERLITSYAAYRDRLDRGEDKKDVYAEALAVFNANPSGEAFVFLTRACYGGVIRFRTSDGAMSTPCGVHMPVSTASFAKRVKEWGFRVTGTEFFQRDFRESFEAAKSGDVIYCDPPYSDSQKILYGAQAFSIHDLVEAIDKAKGRGVQVLMSIDGTKKTGLREVLHDFPSGLFEREAAVNVGRAMLKRFQMGGQSLEAEFVKDRLLLTY